MLSQGPPEPVYNTQAMPLLPEGKRSTDSYAFVDFKTDGFDWNAKNSVQKTIHLSKAEIAQLVVSYNNTKQGIKQEKKKKLTTKPRNPKEME